MPQAPAVDLLVFGAHPDDIEFGCGGVVAREAQAGAAVRLVVCSRGEAGTRGTPETRTAEAEAAASLLGASLEWLDLGGDARIEASRARSVAVARVIRQHRPALLLAPTLVEHQHPDHAALGRIVRDAARLARYGGHPDLIALPPHQVGGVWLYAVSHDAEPRDALPVLVDASPAPVVAAWQAAIRAHASQSGGPDYAALADARARLHGLRAGVERAVALWPLDPPVVNSLRELGRQARAF